MNPPGNVRQTKCRSPGKPAGPPRPWQPSHMQQPPTVSKKETEAIAVYVTEAVTSASPVFVPLPGAPRTCSEPPPGPSASVLLAQHIGGTHERTAQFHTKRPSTPRTHLLCPPNITDHRDTPSLHHGRPFPLHNLPQNCQRVVPCPDPDLAAQSRLAPSGH